MVEVFENVFVGDKEDFYQHEGEKDFSFCLCAKTFHKQYAILDGFTVQGYSGNMNKNETEYLIAERFEQNILAVNLIDAKTIDYIPDEIIDTCIDFIENTVEFCDGGKVLVCCDQGKSRSASVAFMYGIKNGYFDHCFSYEQALDEMKVIYPEFEQGKGMAQYTLKYWLNIME